MIISHASQTVTASPPSVVLIVLLPIVLLTVGEKTCEGNVQSVNLQGEECNGNTSSLGWGI